MKWKSKRRMRDDGKWTGGDGTGENIAESDRQGRNGKQKSMQEK